MCPKSLWEKLVEGSWIRSMSPFDHKVLDICMASSSLETLQVSIVEEFFVYRIIFLFSGILLMSLASSLSKSLVFYYSSAMAVGIILVILMVLFQGMKLLPTGRKYSIGIFVYSSIVGLGSFFLSYLPRLLHTILTQMGISEDMYNPLAIFLLVFLVLAGAWLGFWVVRKLILTEDGLVDVGVSNFVAWSIRIIAIVMILQSSVDPLLAAGALLCGIFVSSLFRRIIRSRFLRHLYRNLLRTDKSNRRHRIPDSSPLKESYDEHTPNIQDLDNSEFVKSQSSPNLLRWLLAVLLPEAQPGHHGVGFRVQRLLILASIVRLKEENSPRMNERSSPRTLPRKHTRGTCFISRFQQMGCYSCRQNNSLP